MLNVINLSFPTMRECDLNDLPSELGDRIKWFLSDNETPTLCIFRKIEAGYVSVYAITSSCVITVSNKIKNNVLLKDDWENQASCIFLSAIKKIECGWGKNEGKITLRGETSDLVEYYRFTDLNLLNKFETVVFSLKRQNDLQSAAG